MRFLIRSILLLGILAASSPFSALAEPIEGVPAIPKPLKVMPSKIKPLQSGTEELSKAAPENNMPVTPATIQELENLFPPNPMVFPEGFWNGASRQDAVAFLSQTGTISAGRSTRQFALKTVLTPFPDVAASTHPTENLYALRIHKLVDLGYFDDAQKLYKLNESAPPTPLAAKAGIEAMLGHGEIAVACLDQKTFEASLKTDDINFWRNLDIFCQALLGPVAGNDDELRLSNASRAYVEMIKPSFQNMDAINQLDIISTLALFKTGAFSASLSTPAGIELLDDKHLSALVSYATPSADLIPLLSVGLEKGMIAPDKALALLKSIDPQTLTGTLSPFLKEYFKNPSGPVLTNHILELATDSVTQSLLIPLYAAPEIAFPDILIPRTLGILALTNQELPLNLIRAAYPSSESSITDDPSGEKLLILALLDSYKNLENDAQNPIIPTLTALQYANYPQKDIKNAYDNVFNLTPSGNYVMPKGDILSSLKESADKKQMNQVVIRSLALLNDKPLEKLHPAALYQVLEALNSAGLTEETIFLTREVLGTLMKK